MNSDKKNEFAPEVLTPATATWVDIKTISEIKGITSRALRISLAKGKYISREVVTQGGKRNPTRVRATPETRPSEDFNGGQIL